MALTDIEIGKFSIELRKTVKNYFLEHKTAKSVNGSGANLSIEEQASGEMSDATLADFLLTTHPDSLNDKSPDGYSELPTADKHSIIERAIQALTPGHGLVFDQNENAQWIRVAVAHEGRTPLREVGDYCWIRLNSIDQVIPKVALGASQDHRGWGWNLQVKTNGGVTFYASDETYRGELILYPQRTLMTAIDSAAKAAHQSDALPKLA